MTDWFADESLWREVFPFEFGDATLAQGEVQVEHVLTLSGVKGGAALDLGCGPGRHAVPLAQHGFRITAVDLSAFHLEKAKARSRRSATSRTIGTTSESCRTFTTGRA